MTIQNALAVAQTYVFQLRRRGWKIPEGVAERLTAKLISKPTSTLGETKEILYSAVIKYKPRPNA